MMAAGIQALLSHWRRRPGQLATLMLGLALATALWSGVQAINAEARASYAEAAAALGETRYAQLLPGTGDTLMQARYVALRRAGWQVSPVIDGRIEAAGTSVRLVGIDPLSAPPDVAPRGFEGGNGLAAFMLPPGELYTHPDTAPALSGAVGAKVVATDGIAPGTAFGDVGVVQRLLDRPGQLSRLILLPDQPLGRAELGDVAPDLILRQPEQGSDIARLTDSFHLNLTAFGLLSFAVGLFIVHGAIGLAFEQRRPVFRTLRALGLPLSRLIVLLIGELVLLATLAGLLGMVLGYGIAAALLPDVAATLRGLYGAEVAGTLSLRPAWWVAGLGIALAGTALAATGALIRVARLPLLAPAQPRAWARGNAGTIRAQAGAAMGLAAISVLAARYGTGLMAGFVMLGALLLATALILPAILSGALMLGARHARSALSEWFWADTRQQLPGLSLALMALLLALAANIGVGTMVSSFRLTFTGWLDQRLASELYVTARDEAEAERLRAWLAPRADAVLPIWSTEARVADAPVFLYGVADHPTYRDHWPLLDALPGVWDTVAAGETILINEQLSLRLRLEPGDLLPLPGGWTPVIAGIYSDYGNPTGQVLVGLDRFVALFPEVPRLRHGVRTDDPLGLAQALIREFGLPPDNLIDQAGIKAFSLQVFERTFTVTAALNVLTLAIAGFAILTSLLTLARMRQPQLAPVWALGMTRAGLARIEVLRALLLAVLTLACAVPAGLVLAWVLLDVINVAAFGWRLPMHLFPLDWLRLGALSALAAVLAALWPARRLARTPPSELLKVFAHER